MKGRIHFIRAGIFFIGVLAIVWMASCREQEQQRPNVLLILADDLGWNQLGCYGGPYDTPNIDSLASGGMRFTQAYSAAAVCSPTRAALMTGRYPARLHLTDFIQGQEFPDSLLSQPEWQKYLPLEEITMAEVFRENGYRTALFGKWHLSQDKHPPGSLPFNPDKQGFDEYMITYKPVGGQTDPGHDPHNIDSITRRSVRFLEEHRQSPFLLVVSHNAIHDPLMESVARTGKYSRQFSGSGYGVDPRLGAMVSRLDRSTGILLQTLERLELTDRTLVLFCSDNGGKDLYASQRPFRRGKGWLYEGGIRVPQIASWPGRIPAGRVNEVITSTIDLLPTILDMTGVSGLPEGIDGISLAGEYRGEDPPREPRNLCWHYPHYHRGSGMKPASAIRVGDLKLIEWHEEFLLREHAWELYDLSADPGEQIDLSMEDPAALEEMRKALYLWRNETEAQMPRLK